MFITEYDYKVIIGQSALAVLSQADSDNRANAESQAVEEISGYLRPKYDVERIFSATGDSRNKMIVMFTCDIALYNMAASAGGRMNSEVRKERYDRAIEWLANVRSGKIVPELPTVTTPDGQTGVPLRWGSEKRLNNVW